MAAILFVHGIANQFSGEHQLRAAWHPAVSDGLVRAKCGASLAKADLVCPFYGDLFRPLADGLSGSHAPDLGALSAADHELVEAVWRAAASSEEAVPSPDEFGDTLARVPRFVERAITALSRSKFLGQLSAHAFIGDLKQVTAYLNDQATRQQILDRVLAHIADDTRVVIGHSLGSVIAYEALCAKAHKVKTYLSFGSPLGLRRVVFDKLTPKPDAAGLGTWPGVARWVNIAAKGDIVASQKTLAPFFGDRVEDRLIDSGWDAHAATRYANTTQAGEAVCAALG